MSIKHHASPAKELNLMEKHGTLSSMDIPKSDSINILQNHTKISSAVSQFGSKTFKLANMLIICSVRVFSYSFKMSSLTSQHHFSLEMWRAEIDSAVKIHDFI